VSTKALPHGGEHFLGGGVLFARAETGISLKTSLRNSVPADRRITPWTAMLNVFRYANRTNGRIGVITANLIFGERHCN